MRKGCWIGIGMFAALVIAAIVVLGKIFTTYYDFGKAAGELPQAIADYRANRLPFTAAELVPKRWADADNAAPGIRIAVKLLPGRKIDSELAAAMKKPGPSADALIAKYEKSLFAINAVKDFRGVDFKRDWDLGPYILFPEYAGMKSLAKAASARALRAAQGGNDASALRDLTLTRKLSTWAGQEPTLISLLVQIANESITLNGFERCLVEAHGRPERIARYSRWLNALPPLPDFGQALKGEAYLGIAITRNLDKLGGMNAVTSLTDDGSGPPPPDPRTLLRDGVPVTNQQKGFLARHLQVWNEVYRTSNGFKMPPSELGRKLDMVSNELEAKKGLSFVLERIMLPVFAQAGEAVTTLEARRAVQKGFAEAMTSYALSKRWPKAVSPIDPFTRHKLKVQFDGTRFRVYSIGRDGKDDGGFLKREKKGGEDVAAAYPPIPL